MIDPGRTAKDWKRTETSKFPTCDSLACELVEVAKPVTRRETSEQEMVRHEREATLLERVNDFLNRNPGWNQILSRLDLARIDRDVLETDNRACLKSRR